MTFKRIARLLQQAAILIVVLIIGGAAILQFVFMAQVYSNRDFLIMAALTCLLMAPLCVLVKYWHLIVSTPRREFLVVLWLMLLAASIRLILLPILSTNAWSDMLTVHLFALDVLAGQPSANLSAYPHIPTATYLNMLGFTLAGFYKLFGASFQAAKAFMTACAVISAGLFYYSGKKLGAGDGRIGFAGALAFATLPSMAAYTGVLSGEHVAILILLLVLIVFSQAMEKLRNPLMPFRNAAWYFAACGVLVGLLDWYRPIGIVLVVALVIAFALDDHKKGRAFSHFALIALLLVSYNLLSRVPLQISEAVFDRRIMSSSDRLGEFLLIGLNPAFKGVNNLNDWDIIAAARKQFGEDFSGYRQYLTSVALSRITPPDLIPIFAEKFARMWSNHEQLFFFVSYGSNDQELLALLRNMDILGTWGVSLFALMGAIFSLARKTPAPLFAMQLFILGFTLITLLLEAQNRYITLVIPYWILLAAVGARQTWAGFNKHLAARQ